MTQVRKISIFHLYRDFWEWAFDNPEIIKPHMAAIFSFTVQRCNRLGWKDKFGLPTTEAMEATGIRSYESYKKHLDSLVAHGFIEMISRSKNQYTSNVIRLLARSNANTTEDPDSGHHDSHQEDPIVISFDQFPDTNNVATIGGSLEDDKIPTLPAFGQIRHKYESRGLLWDDTTGRHCHRLINRIKHRIASDVEVHPSMVKDVSIVEMYDEIVRDGGWWVQNQFSMKTLDLKFAEITQSMTRPEVQAATDRYSKINKTTFS